MHAGTFSNHDLRDGFQYAFDEANGVTRIVVFKGGNVTHYLSKKGSIALDKRGFPITGSELSLCDSKYSKIDSCRIVEGDELENVLYRTVGYESIVDKGAASLSEKRNLNVE